MDICVSLVALADLGFEKGSPPFPPNQYNRYNQSMIE